MKQISSEKLEKLKYPIGSFAMPKTTEKIDYLQAANTIDNFPTLLANATTGLDQNSLQWRYRPNGWRIYEVVHHCVDSHINAFIRFKKALSEDNPLISGYIESEWVTMPDAQELPIQNALDLLNALHPRWAHLLKSLTAEKFDRGYYNPESQRVVKLSEATMLYQWHCRHHLAHVEAAKKLKY